MTLDEYIDECEKRSADPVVKRLASVLRDWKEDSTNVTELAGRVEHFFGSSRMASESVHGALYRMWADFRSDAIDAIGGQTMNERLYFFSLFERFDRAASGTERDGIYAKLLASR